MFCPVSHGVLLFTLVIARIESWCIRIHMLKLSHSHAYTFALTHIHRHKIHHSNTHTSRHTRHIHKHIHWTHTLGVHIYWTCIYFGHTHTLDMYIYNQLDIHQQVDACTHIKTHGTYQDTSHISRHIAHITTHHAHQDTHTHQETQHIAHIKTHHTHQGGETASFVVRAHVAISHAYACVYGSVHQHWIILCMYPL